VEYSHLIRTIYMLQDVQCKLLQSNESLLWNEEGSITHRHILEEERLHNPPLFLQNGGLNVLCTQSSLCNSHTITEAMETIVGANTVSSEVLIVEIRHWDCRDEVDKEAFPAAWTV